MADKNIVIANKKQKLSESKELITRILSSFLFIPAIALLYYSSFEVLVLLCAITFAAMIYEIFPAKMEGHTQLRIAMLIFCALGIISFLYCRKNYGVSGCIFLICIASFTDIGAYCVGKALKGPKLCPKISPNKTWAGFWGGIFLANTACYCLNSLFLQNSEQDLSKYTNNFFIVQLAILASITGDLLESWFKRKIGVKDMGNWFPGHGGILDRFDSLIFVSIFLFIIHFFI